MLALRTSICADVDFLRSIWFNIGWPDGESGAHWAVFHYAPFRLDLSDSRNTTRTTGNRQPLAGSSVLRPLLCFRYSYLRAIAFFGLRSKPRASNAPNLYWPGDKRRKLVGPVLLATQIKSFLFKSCQSFVELFLHFRPGSDSHHPIRRGSIVAQEHDSFPQFTPVISLVNRKFTDLVMRVISSEKLLIDDGLHFGRSLFSVRLLLAPSPSPPLPFSPFLVRTFADAFAAFVASSFSCSGQNLAEYFVSQCVLTANFVN